MNSESSPSRIGEALKRLRGRVTLDEMAANAAIGRTALVNYESGKRLPDQDFLAAFAEATGADFLELLRLRLASSPDEPARRMAERLQAAPPGQAPAGERRDEPEKDWSMLEALLRIAEHKLKSPLTADTADKIDYFMQAWESAPDMPADLVARMERVKTGVALARPE